MATAPRPAFALSKTFIEPTVDCQAMPINVIKSAERIVQGKIAEEERQTEDMHNPVPFATLARILAFEARTERKRYTEAYLSDDAISRFLQAICRELNQRAKNEQLKAALIDLEDSAIRAVTFEPVWWSEPANAFQKGEMSREAMVDRFSKALRRQGVKTSQALLDLQIIFFPRCKNSHWVLNFLCPQKRLFGTLNSATADVPYTAFIKNFVRPFLHGMLGELYQEKEWRDASDIARPAESSQQHNPTDCGAALCLSALALAANKTPSCAYLRDILRIREAIAGTLVLGRFIEGFWEL